MGESRITRQLDEARREMIGVLRERCPTGFMTREQSDKIAKLTPARRKKVLDWATRFPEAINLADLDGRTPLVWLARYDEPRLIKALLMLGADPRGARAREGSGAMHPLAQAVELGHGKALAILALAAGVDAELVADSRAPSGQDNPCAGAKALFMAAMNCNDRGIDTLLSLGADPWATTSKGDTALHALAYYKKSVERARPCAELLERAAPGLILQANHAGHAPAQWALSQASPVAAMMWAIEERARLMAQAQENLQEDKKPKTRL
jgi:hypothetical protein